MRNVQTLHSATAVLALRSRTVSAVLTRGAHGRLLQVRCTQRPLATADCPLLNAPSHGAGVADGLSDQGWPQYSVLKLQGYQLMKTRNYFSILAVIFVALMLQGCGFHTVDTGHRGIKVHFGQVTGDPLPEGLYYVNPFSTSVVQLDIRTLRFDTKEDTYTKDLQVATIQFTVNYALRPIAVGTIYKTVGVDWANTLMPQTLAQDVKDEIGKWDAPDLITSRQIASDHIFAAVRAHLSAVNIDVSSFFITDVAYTKAYDTAVENKVIASQRAQEEQNKTVQIQQQANQRVISATAEAQSMKIRADALSQNPKLVEWEAVQRWNGVLPQYMLSGNGTPFINVSPGR